MLLFVLASLELIVIVMLSFVVVRFSKRLLQYDDLVDAISEPMMSYAADLKRMSSGDLLIDNPEVLAFHRRNLEMLSEIESVTWSVTNGRRVRTPKSNPPSVE